MNKYINLSIAAILCSFFLSCSAFKGKSANKNTQNQSLNNVKWTLKELPGIDIGSLYADFTLDAAREGQVNIKAPCNGYFGSYKVDTKKGKIIIDNLAGTMKACVGGNMMDVENKLISSFNNKTLDYYINGNNLTFTDGKKGVVAVFEAISTNDQISYLKKHNWKLIQMNHTGQDYTQTINFKDAVNGAMTVHGFAGCNGFNGEVKFVNNTIKIDKLMSTLKGCMDATITKQEGDYLSSLRSEGLSFDIADQVLNIYKDNKIVLMFARDDSKK